MYASLAKSTNYYIIFGSDLLSNIKYYVQDLNLPGINLEPITIQNKTRNHIISGGDLQFTDLSFKIVVDENFSNYLALLEEIYSYKNPESGDINIKPFNTDIFITTNKGNPFLKFTLENSYITSIDDVQFTDETQDDEIITLNIVLKYDYAKYEILNTNVLKDPIKTAEEKYSGRNFIKIDDSSSCKTELNDDTVNIIGISDDVYLLDSYGNCIAERVFCTPELEQEILSSNTENIIKDRYGDYLVDSNGNCVIKEVFCIPELEQEILNSRIINIIKDRYGDYLVDTNGGCVVQEN